MKICMSFGNTVEIEEMNVSGLPMRRPLQEERVVQQLGEELREEIIWMVCTISYQDLPNKTIFRTSGGHQLD